MEKLKDILGTIYLYDGIINEYYDTIKSYDEFDIADMRLGCQAAIALRDTDKVVIDSKNKLRQEVLNENRRRRSLNYTITEESIERDIVSFISKLSMDKVYRFRSKEKCEVQFVVILSLLRPEIKIDLENQYPELFKYICKYFYKNPIKDIINFTQNWLLLQGNTFRVINIDVKDEHTNFDILGYGSVNWKSILRDRTSNIYLIPKEFGEKLLYNHPLFEQLYIKSFNKVLDVFKQVNMRYILEGYKEGGIYDYTREA